jgi:hypothetical protein
LRELLGRVHGFLDEQSSWRFLLGAVVTTVA